MNKFLYLVQGQSDLISKNSHLAHRKDADAIFLTYDRPIKNAIFLPNSSWAQGRNKLLEAALQKDVFLYYIFCDDDIRFKTGGWDQFEESLLSVRPAVAVPVSTPKTKKTPLKGLKYQAFLINDEQMMAFHHDVVFDEHDSFIIFDAQLNALQLSAGKLPRPVST